MFTNRSRNTIAMLVAGAFSLFAAQAGAASSQFDASARFAEGPPPTQFSVFDPDGSVSTYTLVPADMVTVTESDGSVAFYKLAPWTLTYEMAFDDDAYMSPYGLAAADQITVFNPDGSSWSYTPVNLSTWYGPFDAAYVTDDDSTDNVYVAHFVSPPSYPTLL